MAALNPGQFKGPLYHGTTYDLQGSDIKPANVVGNSVWGKAGHSGQFSDQHAFATESEHTAWEFGSRAGMMKRGQVHLARTDPEIAATPPDNVSRVRVHEVAPHPLMQKGVYHSDHPDHLYATEDLKEWRAPAFRVKNTQDIMPGRQGTFPSLNWNQFRGPDSGYKADMNHPTDGDVVHGHNVSGLGGSIFDHETNPYTVKPSPVVDEHQLDLFSGKTVRLHAENDGSPVGDYHRNNLFGRL